MSPVHIEARICKMRRHADPRRLERALEGVGGLEHAEIDERRSTLGLVFRPDIVPLPALVRLIGANGFFLVFMSVSLQRPDLRPAV